MHRVKFNDYAELLSDDLNNNNAYLYNGLITTIADFIAANDCVSGLEVTAQAVPDMTVYVKAGRIYQDGYQGFLEADLTTPLTIAPASANQPRIDLICAKYEEVEDEPEIRNVMTDVVSRNITQVEVKTRIASSIAFQVVGGTAAAEPTVPTTPEGWVALAKVTIPANTSVIQQSNIVDMRPKIINIYQHDHSGGANGAKLDYNNLENLPDLSVFKGATTSNNGTKGMVPAPAKGNNNRYLKSDATWGEIDTMKGATSSAAGAAGLVPAPTAGAANRYLRSDGSWQVPPDTKYSNMKGASSSAAGSAGLVPAPTAGAQNKFLRGDGTWADAKMSTKELVDILYPVGHIYMSTNSANPGTLFPGTTWEAYAQGRVLIGAGTGTDSRSEKKTFAAGSTGGEYNHQLTVGEIPAHKHTVTVSLNTAGKHEHTFRAHSGSYTGEHMFYESARDNTSGHEKRNWIDANGNHTHTPTVGEKSIGNNQAHNNIQPYISVYIFRRTK